MGRNSLLSFWEWYDEPIVGRPTVDQCEELDRIGEIKLMKSWTSNQPNSWKDMIGMSSNIHRFWILGNLLACTVF